MRAILTLSLLIFSCFLGTSVIAQQGPGNGGGPSSPPQNPKPINGDDRNGDPGGTSSNPCTSSGAVNEDWDISFFIESGYLTGDLSFTLPNNMPGVRLAVMDVTGIETDYSNLNTLSLIYLSEPVNEFNRTDYACADNQIVNLEELTEGGILDEETVASFLDIDNIFGTAYTVSGTVLGGYFQYYCEQGEGPASYDVDILYAFVYQDQGNIYHYPLELYPNNFTCFMGASGSPWVNSTSFVLTHPFECVPCITDGDGGGYTNDDDTANNGSTNEDNGAPDDGGSGEEGKGGRSNSNEVKANLYPNPFNNVLHISDDYIEFEIRSLDGKKVTDNTLTKRSIETATWDSGIYIFRSFDGRTWTTQKLVKL